MGLNLKLQKIGNSMGVIIPKEELDKRGYCLGDVVPIELLEDEFWTSFSKSSKAEQKKKQRSFDAEDCLLADDFSEWEDL